MPAAPARKEPLPLPHDASRLVVLDEAPCHDFILSAPKAWRHDAIRGVYADTLYSIGAAFIYRMLHNTPFA